MIRGILLEWYTAVLPMLQVTEHHLTGTATQCQTPVPLLQVVHMMCAKRAQHGLVMQQTDPLF